jgi:hypothetical protein
MRLAKVTPRAGPVLLNPSRRTRVFHINSITKQIALQLELSGISQPLLHILSNARTSSQYLFPRFFTALTSLFANDYKLYLDLIVKYAKLQICNYRLET